MVLMSTPSVLSQAGTRLSRRYSGRPEANPVNAQMSMPLVKSCSQTVMGVSVALEAKHRRAAAQVWHHMYVVPPGHHMPPEDAYLMRGAKVFEIVRRAQVLVGRVVP